MNKKIQIIRGLAIFAVVMIHTCSSGSLQVFVRPFLNWSVAMFLFLSGYLTKSENADWIAICKKRVMRVMIPFLVWTIIYTLPGFSMKRLLFNLATAKGAATLYFIFVYVQMVLLTPIFLKLMKPRMGWVMFCAIPVLLFVIKGFTPPHPVLAWVWKSSFLLWYPYYLLGLWLGNGVIKVKIPIALILVCLCLSIVLQMGEGWWIHSKGMGNPGTQLKITSFITSMCLMPIAYGFINRVKLNPRCILLSTIGDYSFGIFLVHLLIISILKTFNFYDIIPFPINSVVILAISYVLIYIVSKVAGKKYSRWLGII